jgi:hypothetical protein
MCERERGREGGGCIKTATYTEWLASNNFCSLLVNYVRDVKQHMEKLVS